MNKFVSVNKTLRQIIIFTDLVLLRRYSCKNINTVCIETLFRTSESFLRFLTWHVIKITLNILYMRTELWGERYVQHLIARE